MTTIYALKDPKDLQIRYIGRTKQPALRFREHVNGSVSNNTELHKWIQGLRKQGTGPVYESLALVEDHEAVKEEKRLIRVTGRALFNRKSNTARTVYRKHVLLFFSPRSTAILRKRAEADDVPFATWLRRIVLRAENIQEENLLRAAMAGGE